MIHNDVVLSADHATTGPSRSMSESVRVEWKVTAETGGKDVQVGQLIALSTRDGKELWRCPTAHGYNSPPDVFVAGGLVWTGSATGRNTEDFTEGRDLYYGRSQTSLRDRPALLRRPPSSMLSQQGDRSVHPTGPDRRRVDRFGRRRTDAQLLGSRRLSIWRDAGQRTALHAAPLVRLLHPEQAQRSLGPGAGTKYGSDGGH